MKRIAIVIANKDFRDEEFFITKDVLDSNGIRTSVFSNEVGTALGRFGGEFEVKNDIQDLDATNYNGIIFVGGSGALERLDNDISYKIINDFLGSGKLVAAICISPVILAKAGALKGKNAVVWASVMDKSAISILIENGAKYVDLPVVVDGNVITGRDFEASEAFGKAIISLLTKD